MPTGTRPDFDAATTTVDLGGEVRLWDFGGSGRPVVLVHGLGGSRASWSAVAGPMRAHGRVVAPDLIGFGDTPPQSRSSGVNRQAELIVDLIEHLGSQPAIVVGNSMGGLISMLVAERRPDLVHRLVLVAAAAPTSVPSVRPALALRLLAPLTPGLGRPAIRRLISTTDPVTAFDRTTALIMADPSRLDPADRMVGIEFGIRRWQMPWAVDAFLEAARSIARALVPPARFAGEMRRIEAPTLVVQGEADRVVPPSSAGWLVAHRPDWALFRLPDVGHVPQLECPRDFVGIVDGWLEAPSATPG